MNEAQRALEGLEWISVAVRCRAIDPIRFSAESGSTFRGGFGRALKQVSCFDRNNCASGCRRPSECVYAYIFETPPPPDTTRLSRYPAAPHPFVIHPPRKLEWVRPGQGFTFGLTLVGRAVEMLPYCILAFEQLGKMGLTEFRGRYEITSIADRSLPFESEGLCREGLYDTLRKELRRPRTLNGARPLPGRGDGLRVEVVTPTEIISGGKPARRFSLGVIVPAALRRLSNLSVFHCGYEPPLPYRDLVERARSAPEPTGRLYRRRWKRPSGRQGRMVPMAGWVGELFFPEVDPVLAQVVHVAGLLHVGKSASFGLGELWVRWAEVGGRSGEAGLPRWVETSEK